MKWMKQLSQAIDYIESNLVGTISYDEAAKIACCSTYYFQRMFSLIVGISSAAALHWHFGDLKRKRSTNCDDYILLNVFCTIVLCNMASAVARIINIYWE